MDNRRVLAADLQAELLAVPPRKQRRNSSINTLQGRPELRSYSEPELDYTVFEGDAPFLDTVESPSDMLLHPDTRKISRVAQRRLTQPAVHSKEQEVASSNPSSQQSSINSKQNPRTANQQQDTNKTPAATANDVTAKPKTSNDAMPQKPNDRKNSRAYQSSARTSRLMSRSLGPGEQQKPRPSVASIRMARPSLYPGCENSPDFVPPLRSKAMSDIIGRLNVLIVLALVLLIMLIIGGSYLAWTVSALFNHVTQDGAGQLKSDGYIKPPHDAPEPTSVRDCMDVMHLGYRESGVYDVSLDGLNISSVYCDMDTAGGGWTVLMRRQDNSIDFNRGWDDYKYGFGDLEGEFWAGNEFMNQITLGDSKRRYSLRVDLTSFDLVSLYAEYTEFSVASISDFYRLYISGYSGTAGDSLIYHNACRFSTAEMDNDFSPQNCAEQGGAPWWFNQCHRVFLTGQYGSFPGVDENRGIVWRVPWGTRMFAKYVDMKIRPCF